MREKKLRISGKAGNNQGNECMKQEKEENIS